MYDHTDPTAWIAIANVERERKRAKRDAEKPKPKPKPDRLPYEPVDWKKVICAKNKAVYIDKAWKFKKAVERSINERTSGSQRSTRS